VRASENGRVERFDVVIVGGGLIGLSLAAALGGAGLTVGVIDRERPELAAADSFDGRGSAIAWGSMRVLRAIGLGACLDAHGAPIREIRVSDGASKLFVHYDHRALGDHPLGAIVENRHLRRALYARLAELASVELIAPAALASTQADATAQSLRLADGTRLRAPLVIACDGHDSPLRRAAGIAEFGWSYDQVGLVTAIAHERAHQGIAHERFLPAGPLAVLPLPDGEDGSHRSSIVWTERAELAPAMMALGEDEFSAELRRRFGDHLGAMRLVARRWAYPLRLLQAASYTAPRLALAGDAAHVIHPIAGQGLNLGLRDVAALAECLVDARRLGLDIGASSVLARYEHWRHVDATVLAATTDALTRLFTNTLAPVVLARDIGLALVNRLPPLKNLFMRHAMGVIGDTPRLVRGEAL
jgi:2-octaprenyl-6-methoxyphenol hydroxylase